MSSEKHTSGPVDVIASTLALLKHISPNGQEIWNWLGLISKHSQLLHELQTLSKDVQMARTQCGSCSQWMTRDCPMEKHSDQTGRSTGPSGQAFKCGKFSMTKHAEQFVEKKQERLAEVRVLLGLDNEVETTGSAS